jgi:hypothetical protein
VIYSGLFHKTRRKAKFFNRFDRCHHDAVLGLRAGARPFPAEGADSARPIALASIAKSLVPEVSTPRSWTIFRPMNQWFYCGKALGRSICDWRRNLDSSRVSKNNLEKLLTGKKVSGMIETFRFTRLHTLGSNNGTFFESYFVRLASGRRSIL